MEPWEDCYCAGCRGFWIADPDDIWTRHDCPCECHERKNMRISQAKVGRAVWIALQNPYSKKFYWVAGTIEMEPLTVVRIGKDIRDVRDATISSLRVRDPRDRRKEVPYSRSSSP
jgi:hypothetical protein